MTERTNGRFIRSIKYVRRSAAKVGEIALGRGPWPGLNTLPNARASTKLIQGCMVLEGGSFRGMYTAGALDVFMENDINLTATVGTSAGALNGVNYTAGEIGRSVRISLKYRHDSRYMGVSAVAHGQSVLGLRFIVEDVCREVPLDFKRLNDQARRLAVTATDCITGNAVYFEKGRCVEFLKAVRASASLPFVSRIVWVEGIPCLDGGCSVKVPYEWALENGYDKIIVVRTRHRGFRKSEEESAGFENLKIMYKDYPCLLKRLNTQAEAYNRQCEELERLRAAGRIYMLNPSESINLGAMEGNLDRMAEVYRLGRADALNKLAEIREYLER